MQDCPFVIAVVLVWSFSTAAWAFMLKRVHLERAGSSSQQVTISLQKSRFQQVSGPPDTNQQNVLLHSDQA
jgi:hypothetical protein